MDKLRTGNRDNGLNRVLGFKYYPFKFTAMFKVVKEKKIEYRNFEYVHKCMLYNFVIYKNIYLRN